MTVSVEDLKMEIQGKGLVFCAKRQFIPDGEALANEAWSKVFFSGRRITPEEAQEKFDTYLCELVDTEYQLYREYEQRCMNQGVFQLALESIGSPRFPNVQKVVRAALVVIGDPSLEDSAKFLKFAGTMRLFHKFVEQSFAQGRMTRAGESSQYHFQKLLELAGYGGEFETQQVLNGAVDFLFPSREMWEKDRQRFPEYEIPERITSQGWWNRPRETEDERTERAGVWPRNYGIGSGRPTNGSP